MDKSSKPAGSTTQTTTTAPWEQQAPYLASLYQRARTVTSPDLQYFPGQTFASPTAQQEQAIGLQGNLATNDPTMQAATSGINPYLNGSMLNAGNPYFGNMVNQLGQAIAPSIDSHFNMNGRAGSGANNQAFASALTNQAGQMAYQNYNDQSTNQLKALLLAPQISGGNFNDIAQLGAAGAQQQAFNQLPITDAVNRFNFNQDQPFIQAQRFGSLIGAPMSGGGSSTSPYFTNPVGSALGTGIGLASLYGMGNNISGGALNSGVSGMWNSLFNSGAGAISPDTFSTLSATSPGDL